MLSIYSLSNPAPGEGSVPAGLFFPWLSSGLTERQKRTELGLDLLEDCPYWPVWCHTGSELHQTSVGIGRRPLVLLQLKPALELEISQNHKYLLAFQN